MTPQPEQYIIVCLRNGAQLDGIVVSWSDTKSILRSKQNTSITVIQNTINDVIYYRLFDSPKKTEEIIAKPNKTENDIRSLAELRSEAIDIEKRTIQQRLSTHSPSSAAPVYYAFPNIQPKPIPEHSEQKTGTKTFGNNSSLSSLFKKK